MEGGGVKFLPKGTRGKAPARSGGIIGAHIRKGGSGATAAMVVDNGSVWGSRIVDWWRPRRSKRN